MRRPGIQSTSLHTRKNCLGLLCWKMLLEEKKEYNRI